MRNRKLTLFTVMMLLPVIALAHGEDAILPFLYLIILGIAFAITMTALKIDIITKLSLIVIYIITAFLCVGVLLSGTYGDYLKNKTTINAQLLIYPIIAVLLGYFVIGKFKPKSNQ